MSAPNFVELIDAVADLIETTADYVYVARNPIYSSDTAEYARLLKGSTGVVDGWIVMAGPEEEELPRADGGADQTCYIELVAMTTVNRDLSPSGSLAYFGGKVQQVKDVFRIQTNRDLGLDGGGVQVRQYGAYAPEGYVSIALDTELVHLASMRMRVFVSFC